MKTIAELRAALKELSDRIVAFQSQTTDFTAEDLKVIKDTQAEMMSLKNQIEAKEALESMSLTAQSSQRQSGNNASAAASSDAQSAGRQSAGNVFATGGEFLMAVKNSVTSGKTDPRLTNATMMEKNGEDGGYLVPSEMMTEIRKKLDGDESLLARTRQFTVSGNNLTLPTDESQPWTGGIQAYWIAEAQKYIDSKPNLGEASFKLHKLGVMVKATDELLEDSVALESYIRTSAPEAIMHTINEAILTGDGVGKPKGILNSAFRVIVPKEVGQLADTIVAENIIKMYSRMIPSARGKGVWFINAGAEEGLRGMKDAQGNYIFLSPGSQFNTSPYGILMGRPVVPMMGAMPALGDEGDIIFADLSYYYTVMKSSGMKSAISTHLLFDRDITAFKFTMRIDGNVPFKAPVKTQYGNYEMSGIVTLAARA